MNHDSQNPPPRNSSPSPDQAPDPENLGRLLLKGLAIGICLTLGGPLAAAVAAVTGAGSGSNNSSS